MLNNDSILAALRGVIPSEFVDQAADGSIVVDGVRPETMVLGWSDPEDEDDPASGADWVDWTVYGPDAEIQEQDGGSLGAAVNRARSFVGVR